MSKKLLSIFLVVSMWYVFARIGILVTFGARLYLDQRWLILMARHEPVKTVQLLIYMVSNPVFTYGLWGGIGVLFGWKLAQRFLMQKR